MRTNIIKQNLALLTAFLLFAGGASPQVFAKEGGKSKGAELIEKNGCLNCHFIKGDGGLIGPPLDGIGKYRSETAIIDTLTGNRPLPEDYPKGVLDPREYMRHIRIGKPEAQEIAKYLISIKGSEEPLSATGHKGHSSDALPEGFKFQARPVSESSRKGFALFKDSGCAACHAVGGIGGRIGPSLDGVGARRSRDYIENRISEGAIAIFNGSEYRPTQYSMPPSDLSQKEIAQITDFLFTLPVRPAK